MVANAETELKIKTTTIDFSIKNAGLKVAGKFNAFDIHLQFDSDAINMAKIEAKIDVNSINTGINARDKHLKKEEYFDTEKYPFILFSILEIKKEDQNIFTATAELVIKNIKKKITFPFRYANKRFSGDFAINRIDYGVGGSSWILSDKVLVSFEVIVY